MNIRGASKSFIDRLVNASAFKGDSAFGFLNAHANRASYLEPIANAVTAVNNAALETGAYPDQNGIIGNSFGKPSDKSIEQVSGFGTPFLSATIWENASRSGKKVIRLGTLQINGSGKNDFTVPTLPQVSPLSEGQLLELSVSSKCPYRIKRAGVENFRCLTNAAPTSTPGVKLSFGPLQRELTVVAVDSVRDGRPNFQSLIVDDDYDEKNGYVDKIAQAEWVSLLIKHMTPASVGSRAKLLELSPDLKTVRLYVGPAFQNSGYPDSFVSDVEKQVGFAAGGPDYQGYVRGNIGLDTLMEQAHRETDYMQKVALYCLKSIDFDLLLYDQPILDRYGHYSYSKSNHEENLPAIRAGYLATDENIKSLLNAIEKKTTSLVIVSGHGFSAAHTSFSVKKLFASLDVEISPAAKAEVSVFPSKISAHVYLNDRGGEEGENKKYLARLKERLQNYRDPISGETIMDKVLLRSEMAQFHLDNKLYGSDLWVCLKPGYTFDGLIEPDKLVGKPFFVGEHGYFDSSPEVKGVFYYLGSKTIKMNSGAVDSVDVAAVIYQLLGI